MKYYTAILLLKYSLHSFTLRAIIGIKVNSFKNEHSGSSLELVHSLLSMLTAQRCRIELGIILYMYMNSEAMC